MNEATSIFKTHQRFLRSTHLERDWHDPAALESYTLTKTAKEALSRIVFGLKPSSSLRAWRITGDYGSGKSSFALFIAKILSRQLSHIPATLKSELRVEFPELFKSNQPSLIPVLITGSREPLGFAILRSLLETLKAREIHRNVYKKLEEIIESETTVKDEIVIEWLKKTQDYLSKSKKGQGIALLIDEAGKFLEYASLHPQSEDIHLLQTLAEYAVRSKSTIFYIITILHQGITAYSNNLSKIEQKEWEKVASRYEEIVWHYPVEQTAIIVANALNTEMTKLSKGILSSLKNEMKETLKLGWFGVSADKSLLTSIAEKVYPLHPTVLPILVRLFSFFGQNERSLFSFLLGVEPFGLQDFTKNTNAAEVFRLHNLYDYARNTFGSKLGANNYHWKAIDATISSNATKDEKSVQILKTVGIINLINSDDLSPSKEILELALSQKLDKILKGLKESHIVHFRGHGGGYCVWPNSSVNLDIIYNDAKKVIGEPKAIKTLIKERVGTRPIVARRHYIETGSLRYFEIKYVPSEELSSHAQISEEADGQIIVALCTSALDIQVANEFSKSLGNTNQATVIVISPILTGLAVYIQELKIWEWVEKSTPELRQDIYAREEVTRRVQAANLELNKKLQSYIGFTTIDSNSELIWFYQGKQVKNLRNGRDVMSFLARIFDDMFAKSPVIHNELVNRRFLSSAGSLARLRLIQLIIEHSDKAYLGMDPTTHPPEMSMYLSVLQKAGLHGRNDKTGYWGLRLPNSNYDEQNCRVLPVMDCIHEMLSKQEDKRLPVIQIFDSLKRPPYGLRDGLAPLFLAIFSTIHEQEIAFYEDGTFVSRITHTSFHRLIKAPETYEIQYYPINSIRSTLFYRLLHDLELSQNNKAKVEILDIVRSLFGFIGGLPEYVMNTSNLSPITISIREVLRKSKDPVQLIFHDLPKSCGLSEISNHTNITNSDLNEFVKKLKQSIDELRAAYPLLLQSIQDQIFNKFSASNHFEESRELISKRANALSVFITEVRLKGFCLRLADSALSREAWIESIGNYICSMPVSKWKDKDSYNFQLEIHNLTQHFSRVEATLYQKKRISEIGHSVRIALTRPTGEERDQVVHLTTSEISQANQLGEKLRSMLAEHGSLGVVAASEVLWEMMGEESKF